MSEFVVHGVAGSPYTRSVLMGLEEKGLPFRLAAMSAGTSKTEEHLQRHPFGRVPVLDHGDLRLYETQAILRYLDALVPEPPLQPTDPRAAARMNQIVGITDWYFFPKATAGIAWQRIVAPRFFGRACDEAIVAEAVPQSRICVHELDRLIGDQPYLAGENPTVADLLLAPQFEYFMMTPEGAEMTQGTRLPAWLARMQARSSMQTTATERLLKAA